MANPKVPTPHITAGENDFAKTVLMPGDPLRAKYIAENFLEDAVLVNNVRGVQGYTGTYNGKKVSVMASGMGIPSIGIYSYELFNFYGVENIIRIGTAGTITEELEVGDIALGMGACTNSNFMAEFGFPGNYSAICSFDLLRKAVEKAEELGYRYKAGNIYSSDVYYGERETIEDMRKMGVMAIEMEAAMLYANAARAGKNALCICTISNSILTGFETTAEERQNNFTKMMKLALEIA